MIPVPDALSQGNDAAEKKQTGGCPNCAFVDDGNVDSIDQFADDRPFLAGHEAVP
ncbi:MULTISPECIES: hypothetical protein [unclassified Cryobacterium]|uniref:hypothetical protein n=1 Tax=unclassified Cryobacterium TaxID=2649013 RepID=UPI00141B64E1|nr:MULTISPECIES: hypothetical protein [unclassified Cryobacterium]